MLFVLWYLCIGAVFVMAMIIYCLYKKIAEEEIDNLRNLSSFAVFVGIMINAVAWPYYAYTIGKAVFHKILHDKRNGH